MVTIWGLILAIKIIIIVIIIIIIIMIIIIIIIILKIIIIMIIIIIVVVVVVPLPLPAIQQGGPRKKSAAAGTPSHKNPPTDFGGFLPQLCSLYSGYSLHKNFFT